MSDMPEKVVCYYIPGRREPLQVAEELYEKDWRQEPYILKSIADAERAADDKTIRELADILRSIRQISENTTDQRTFNLVRINRGTRNILSDNKERIAEAQESKND